MSQLQYISLSVTVTLDIDGTVHCQPKQLNIPSDTIATVTWTRTVDNFKFKAFKWCQSNGFLTPDPIIHDGCVISAVHNEPGNQGTYCYRLTVVHGSMEFSTPQCPDTPPAGGATPPATGPGFGDGQPKIKNQ